MVKLTKQERGDLVALIRRGKRKVSAIKRRHARVLLKVDQGDHGPSWTDARTAEALELHATTVRGIRERFVLEGLDAALLRKKQSRPSVPRKLDGAQEARRLARRLEIHFTPKHGSWLNIAELELQALSKQCLDRRIESRAALAHEVQTWTERRNAYIKGIDWQFRTDEARTKLKRLYPEFKS